MLTNTQLEQLKDVAKQLNRFVIYKNSDKLGSVEGYHIEAHIYETIICKGTNRLNNTVKDTLLFIDMYYNNLKLAKTLSLSEILTAEFDIVLNTLIKMCYEIKMFNPEIVNEKEVVK